MAYNVLLSQEAQMDVDDAVYWYEEQQQGLGIRFYMEVLGLLEKLERTPQHYSFIHEMYRHVVLHFFPFHIIFKIITATDVLVVAVWHTSKNSEDLFKRMK